MKKKSLLKKILMLTLCLILVIGISVLVINAVVKNAAKPYLINAEDAAELSDIDCIIVLGCHVKNNGEPSDMLTDRLKRGVELYYASTAPKLLMSGDHGQHEYNEVDAMKKYALDAEVPSEDIFMDHAGFSTYDSIYRAKEIFEAEKVIVVTQEYHLYRALYIAQKLGLEAYGVTADYRSYIGQTTREIREILARAKDFVYVLLKIEPTFLGETIPISGDGNITDDEASEEI